MVLASHDFAGPGLTVALAFFLDPDLSHQLLLAAPSLDFLVIFWLNFELALPLDLVVGIVEVVSLEA